LSLKPKHTTEYNGIPNKILKYFVHFISKSYICNCSPITGIFSEICKFAIVQPIIKWGGGSNYRPISLIKDVSKILKTISFKTLEQHP
jgi:hypothetical protein